jgi:hypothetical protein
MPAELREKQIAVTARGAEDRSVSWGAPRRCVKVHHLAKVICSHSSVGSGRTANVS